MSQVPTNNLSALYSNSTPGTVISPTIFDAAIQDIVSTINTNDSKVDGLVTSGTLSPIPPDFMQRQAIINGNFDVSVRGLSFTNPASGQYTLDHWQNAISHDGGTVPSNIIFYRYQLPSGYLDKSAYYLSMNFNGAGSGFGANAYAGVFQPIEYGTRYLCGVGKKVTVSFYARSSIVGKRMAVGLSQRYGSGGSPTLPENLTTSGQIVSLTSDFTKFTLTFTTNTLTGKTFGTNDDDHLLLQLFTMWGTNTATNFGGGAAETFGGSGAVDIAQVQVCAGDVALPFQPRTVAEEQALCQRYTYIISDELTTDVLVGNGGATTTTTAIIPVRFPVRMRVRPTLSATPSDWQLADGVNANVVLTGLSLANRSAHNSLVTATVASGLTQFRPYILIAGGASRRMIFDAEI